MLRIVYNTEQRKHQRSASLAFVLGIHRWPVNSTHKGPVTRQKFSFDDVIMFSVFVWRMWSVSPWTIFSQRNIYLRTVCNSHGYTQDSPLEEPCPRIIYQYFEDCLSFKSTFYCAVCGVTCLLKYPYQVDNNAVSLSEFNEAKFDDYNNN